MPCHGYPRCVPHRNTTKPINHSSCPCPPFSGQPGLVHSSVQTLSGRRVCVVRLSTTLGRGDPLSPSCVSRLFGFISPLFRRLFCRLFAVSPVTLRSAALQVRPLAPFLLRGLASGCSFAVAGGGSRKHVVGVNGVENARTNNEQSYESSCSLLPKLSACPLLLLLSLVSLLSMLSVLSLAPF